MKTFTKQVSYTLIPFKQLEIADQELLRAAAAVRNNAQAPYSHFHVGAAVRTVTGRIHVGCNVERCSYTQSTHAEQNAVDTMVAQEGSVQLSTIALVAASEQEAVVVEIDTHPERMVSFDNMPISCGHCRQIIWENCFNNSAVKILSLVKNGVVLITTMGDLLPLPFGPAQVGISY